MEISAPFSADQSHTWTKRQTMEIATSDTSLDLQATVDRMVLRVIRYNPPDQWWVVGTHIGAQGQIYTNAWVVISGDINHTPDAEGNFLPKAATTDSSMLSIVSDVTGTALELMGLNNALARTLQVINPVDRHYVFGIDKDGKLRFGDATSYTAMDVNLYRSAADTLRTDDLFVAAAGIVTNGGTTASRPAAPVAYQSYFDTTLGKPIWYSGAAWVDATGATV